MNRTNNKGVVTIENTAEKLLRTQDIIDFFGFGKTKMTTLFQAGVLPVVKIGKDYVTTNDAINEWIKENRGKEIFF